MNHVTRRRYHFSGTTYIYLEYYCPYLSHILRQRQKLSENYKISSIAKISINERFIYGVAFLFLVIASKLSLDGFFLHI